MEADTDMNTSYYNDYSEEDGYVDGYDYYYDVYELYDGEETFLYESYDFEKIIYLYVWEILVIVTSIANVLVITVFMNKRLRNSTNVLLLAVAATDSLTGLVTLPVYIYVFGVQNKGKDKVYLSETWCEVFMFFKMFVSSSFHTMSIWLTVLLAFQRLVSVCFPFKAQSLFTIPRTIIIIVVVVVISPVLHIYHVYKRKATAANREKNSTCTWELEEPCTEGCIYMWLRFYIVHFIPCLLLIVFTVGMVIIMCKNSKKLRSSHLITNNMSRRNADSRRISTIVIVVVIVFLIPEVPFGFYVLMSVSLHLSRNSVLQLKANRIFNCVYEISLILSFHANFWIYFVMSRRFRRGLKKLFMPLTSICCGIVGNFRMRRRSESSSFTYHVTSQNTSGGGLEMTTSPGHDRQEPRTP